MKKAASVVLKYMAVFTAAVVILTAILCLAAMIPKEKIREHALESAEYLSRGELKPMIIEGVKGSMQDRYADAILLNIAWSYDVRYPLRSVMLSAYYFTPDHEENENFLIAVREDKEPNQQYLRYWHGSIAVVRPLLTILPVRGIYAFNAVLLMLLFLILMTVLLRMHEPVPAFGILMGSILTAWWFVPLSLEYTWMCQLSLLACIIMTLLFRRGRKDLYGLFFFITGIVTIYLDFFTTETLTLLLPLLTLIWLERRKENVLKITAEAVISWGAGYVGMWVMKWIMAAAVFRENVIPYLSGHVEEWLIGTAGYSFLKHFALALFRNVSCMFPAGYGAAGAAAAIILFLAAIFIGIRYRRREADLKLILIWAALGLIPFLRYSVLRNHSFRHFFFTYRALAATVFAIVLILAELTGIGRKGGGQGGKD